MSIACSTKLTTNCSASGHDQRPTFTALWRRSAVTDRGVDHAIVPGITGRGAYVGTFLGIAALERYWWGEGEVKFYLDGDEEYPTICGTGTEDYVGGAWAFQEALTQGSVPEVCTFQRALLRLPAAVDRGRHGLVPLRSQQHYAARHVPLAPC